jgi:4-alpha-glucanotransferase
MPEKGTAAKIAALGRLCGIAPEYRDSFERRRRTSLATCKGLLTAMGVPWEDPARLELELARRRLRPFHRLVPPVQVISLASRPSRVAVYPWTPTPELRPQVEVQGRLADEAGQSTTWESVIKFPTRPMSRQVEDGFRTRVELSPPPGLKPGYYDLTLRVQGRGREETGETRLVVAPPRVYRPPWLSPGRRAWGLNLPLYALRSDRNWGIGDFGDLMDLVPWAGSLEAAFVGVSPLHAPAPKADSDPSPYSPTSRVFLNFLYLNLEMVPELKDSAAAQTLLASQEFAHLKARLQASELVAYPEVYRLKRQVLELLYQTFEAVHGPPEAPVSPRGEEFVRFLAAQGESLTKFGQFAALADFLGHSDWRLWPAAYQTPESPAVALFAQERSQDIHLHQYGQWLAATQLDLVRRQAMAQGLPFSLYQDLALGAASGGFDTWAQRELFAQGAAIGAPPDVFNPKGQNWGLPPMIPERLRESRYQFFIDTLRANLPEDGMVRLDHVMGLFRLFWIPQGSLAGEGAYVTYPARELLAILALESVRRRTLIIGEDLGTLAPHIRRDLAKGEVFSYRVFYFERTWDRGFRAPEDYPRQAVAAVTTHDLPTLFGFWQGRDIELKRDLHLYPDPHLAHQEAADRSHDRLKLLEALSHRGLLPRDFPVDACMGQSCPEEVRAAELEYLAQSAAALLEVRLEEIFGLSEQQNLPGTRDEHPNWRLKLPLTLEQIRRAPEPARLAARLNRYRGRGNFGGGG